MLGLWKDGVLDSDTAVQILGQAALDRASLDKVSPATQDAGEPCEPSVMDNRKHPHGEMDQGDDDQDDLDKVFEDAKRHKMDSRHAYIYVVYIVL